MVSLWLQSMRESLVRLFGHTHKLVRYKLLTGLKFFTLASLKSHMVMISLLPKQKVQFSVGVIPVAHTIQESFASC